jgi:glycosyltransferase involved in cell wall biosynthesis
MGIADGELLVVRVARCSNVYLRSVRMGLELAMRLSREGQPARFLHAGYLEDTEIAREIRRLVDQANSQVGRSIAFSLTNDLEAGVRYLAAADVCVASGRSAIEALALGRPTFVAWGSRYLGLIDRENVESVAQTNFQGRNTKKVGSDEDTVSGMFAAVRARFAEPDRGARTQEVCARIIRERYSVESAAEAYERLYADRTVTIDGFLRHFSNPRQLGRDLFHRLPPGVRFSRPMNFLRKSAIWPGLQKTD